MKKINLSTSSKLKGFTLIELLVVIAIIGLLSTLAVVALNSARQKARDAKRVADIKQVQTALELFYNDNSGYPWTPDGDDEVVIGRVATDDDCGGSACTLLCFSDELDSSNDGFQASGGCDGSNNTTFMGLVPAAPRPPATADYRYHAYQGTAPTFDDCTIAGDKCTTYEIIFDLEKPISSLGNGTNCMAYPIGMICN